MTPALTRAMSQMLAICEKSPFAAQFIYNLMGPVFFELMTMMAIQSSDNVQVTAAAAVVAQQNREEGLKLSTVLKFLCFVYLESALQYESTEDFFETLAFCCDQLEVVELQEYCSRSLTECCDKTKSVSRAQRPLRKRICDYLVLFLGGRIPFYLNEKELTLLQSVLIETALDVFCGQQSEFDLTENGIKWMQEKVLKSAPKSQSKNKCNIVVINFLLILLGCKILMQLVEKQGGNNLFLYSFVGVLSICKWFAIKKSQASELVTVCFCLANPEKSVIAEDQPLIEIILYETGS